MCDYSLESFARRDAKAGDQLRTERIGGYGSIGLVAPDAPQVAVCLRPGTRLIVSGIPDVLQRNWNIAEVSIATFAQREALGVMNMLRRSGEHRDGVRFDGAGQRFVLFQELPVGLEISVETIPGAAEAPSHDSARPELVSA